MNFGNRRFQRCPRGKQSCPSSSLRRRRTAGSEAARGSEVPALAPSSPAGAICGPAPTSAGAETATCFRAFVLRGDALASIAGDDGSCSQRGSSWVCSVTGVRSPSTVRTGKIRGSVGTELKVGLDWLVISNSAEAAACGDFGIESAAGVGRLAAISLAEIVDGPKAFRALRLYSTTKGFVGRFMEPIQVGRSFSISTGQ